MRLQVRGTVVSREGIHVNSGFTGPAGVQTGLLRVSPASAENAGQCMMTTTDALYCESLTHHRTSSSHELQVRQSATAC